MVENFLRGGAAVNVLAREAGARVVVADFGVAAPPRRARTRLVDCRDRARAPRTWPVGPAMTREQAIARDRARARALAEEAIAAGADLLGTGEMGIGNTTAASAITAAITGAPAEARHRPRHRHRRRRRGGARSPWSGARSRSIARTRRTRLDVLAKVGGFEIGGLVGVILAGRRAPRAGRARRLHRRRRGADRRHPRAGRAARAVRVPSLGRARPRSARSTHLGLAPYLDLAHAAGRGDGRRALHPSGARGRARSTRRWRPSSRPGSTWPRDRLRRARAGRSARWRCSVAAPAARASPYRDMTGREVTLAAPPPAHRVAGAERHRADLRPRRRGAAGRAHRLLRLPARRPRASRAWAAWWPRISRPSWPSRPISSSAPTEGSREETFTQLRAAGVPGLPRRA